MVFNPQLSPSASSVERDFGGERISTPILPTPKAPTLLETLEAQVLYTAVMTDTLIEEETEQ